MKIAMGVMLFSCFLLVSACGTSPSQDTPEVAFKKSCASCHGGDLTGGVGPDLTSIGSKYTKEEILSIINNGIGKMTGGKAHGEDAEKIASWLAMKK